MFHGQGTSTYADETKYIGEHKEGERNGQGTYFFADGRVWEGQWRNDDWVNGRKYAAGEYKGSTVVTTNTPSTGGTSSEELAEARQTAKIERGRRQQPATPSR